MKKQFKMFMTRIKHVRKNALKDVTSAMQHGMRTGRLETKLNEAEKNCKSLLHDPQNDCRVATAPMQK